MAPLTTPTTTGPASPPVTQMAAVEAGSVAAGASTLIDLGAAGQQAESTETPVSSVLENELKALGKCAILQLFFHCACIQYQVKERIEELSAWLAKWLSTGVSGEESLSPVCHQSTDRIPVDGDDDDDVHDDIDDGNDHDDDYDDDDDDDYTCNTPDAVCHFTCLCIPSTDKMDNKNTFLLISKFHQETLFPFPREQGKVIVFKLHAHDETTLIKFLPLVGLHDIDAPPTTSNSQIPLQVLLIFMHLHV